MKTLPILRAKAAISKKGEYPASVNGDDLQEGLENAIKNLVEGVKVRTPKDQLNFTWLSTADLNENALVRLRFCKMLSKENAECQDEQVYVETQPRFVY